MKTNKNINAFVVDDSFLNRQLLKTILEEDFGIVVKEAADGKEALDMLNEYTPDFMILDLMMPIMDGLTALQNIRAQKLSFPVIILTADIQETTKQKCMNLGVFGFLNKPSSETDIVHLIEELINKMGK